VQAVQQQLSPSPSLLVWVIVDEMAVVIEQVYLASKRR
jgi:hypothetical protein